MSNSLTYVVTDIEANGPYRHENAMLSIGSVAVSGSLEIVSSFTVNLKPRAGSRANPKTIAWFETEAADAYAAVQTDPVEPAAAMTSFVDWVLSLPAPRIFAAHPMIFDGGWIDEYLKRYTSYRLFDHAGHANSLFARTGLDLPSLIMGATGMAYLDCHRERLDPRWFDGHTHRHCALDDAMGYATVLINVLKLAQQGETRLKPGKVA